MRFLFLFALLALGVAVNPGQVRAQAAPSAGPCVSASRPT